MRSTTNGTASDRGVRVFSGRSGATRRRRYPDRRRYAVVAVFALAAVITPSGDPITLMMLALPMVGLYFLAALIGWVVGRRRARKT